MDKGSIYIGTAKCIVCRTIYSFYNGQTKTDTNPDKRGLYGVYTECPKCGTRHYLDFKAVKNPKCGKLDGLENHSAICVDESR